MLKIRRSDERGMGAHGWLLSRHTFSFANYYDSQHMGFRDLRVINEDRIKGGTGFGLHSHRDMEIISYVISGALKHEDSLGNTTVIYPGDVQRMSAGTGVQHSEYNYFPNKDTHFLQIWILPNSTGLVPSYGQKSFKEDLEGKKQVLVVSQDGREGSISMAQDVDLYLSRLQKGDILDLEFEPDRHGWIQMIKGTMEIDRLGKSLLKEGDGLAISDERILKISAHDREGSEFMLFQLS